MAEEIKDLIEKINREGIQAAEEKARQIDVQADKSARQILEKARADAERIIADAQKKSVDIKESTHTLLKQAGRDLLLSLRKEINLMLDKLIASVVTEAFSAQEMAKIIICLAENYTAAEKSGITVALKKEDLEHLEKGLLSGLKDELNKGITLTPSEDIRAGFTISYDSGKSHYDFTDKGLSEYIGAYLKPKLGELFK